MAESSSPAEPDYLDLCRNTVRNLEDILAGGEHLLNPRQCKDLSSKLSTITRNVRELVLYCKTSIASFRPALENLCRCLGKAEALVRSCAEEDWCAAAILQIQNESAFRTILLDVGSCYKTIHEVAKSTSKDWNGFPEDLEQSSVFEPARDEDVHEDQVDLEKRLNHSAQFVFLNLCRKTVLYIRNLVKSDMVLLNQRQCVDLSTKLCTAALNVFQLVSRGGASDVARFELALESLYRFLEKAKALVSSCAGDDWLAAAVFQIDNENAFRMILLDVSLCYNAIYELVKSTSTDWDNPPEDLRQPSMSVFKPAPDSDIDEDKLDLQKRLDELANGYTKFKPMDYLVRRGKISRAQSLAKYLLVKICSTPSSPQVAALDMYSAILWRKNSEPNLHTWGGARLLGAGSGASGVVSTTWLDIPCAKKEFHGQVNEGFFLREAGILAHLKHPCVVDFVCCGNGSEKGDRFIAMELMEKSLAELIEERNGAHFPLPVVVDMMVQIARGVCYLHGRGVAHRDLKPQNVVVNKLTSLHGESYYCVKLVDFGMSKTKVEVSKFNTMTDYGIGTTRYRAPELGRQAHPDGCGKAAWFEADVFSFAMTCAHLLSLKAPFEEMEALRELYKELMSGVRPSLQADCPKELVLLLKDCWSTRPKARPTFKEVCVRLEKFKYRLLKGFVGGEESDESNFVGFDFIKRKVEEQSSNQVMLVDTIDDDEEGKAVNGVLQTLACPFGHILEFLPQLPTSLNGQYCNICWEDIGEEFYRCGACDFDGHAHCSQLKLEVNVSFHQHPLHLLIQNYHNGDPNAICCFCEESVQHSEWVYRCEQCDIDVHAMCTKYPEERMRYEWHEHPLILIQCPPRKSFSCVCCNGTSRGNTWRYTCTNKWCTFNAHPLCLISSGITMVCVFDNAHDMHQIRAKKRFYCGRCGGLGFSWCYECDVCDANIHLDCIHNMVEEDNQDLHFEEFGTHYMTKDDLTCVGPIRRILHKLLVGNDLVDNSSWALEPTPVAEGSTSRVQPTIRRLASSETPHLNAIDFGDVDLRNKIAAEAEDRKARRTTAKAGRPESKAKYLEMLKNLERSVLHLRSSESALQGDGEELDAGLEELKIRKNSVEDEMATLVQSRMRHGPRTCLFFLDKYEDRGVWELLTSLGADMEDVCVLLLCEEPGDQHDVDCCFRWLLRGALGEERVKRLQPLLGRGLEVVATAVSASLGELASLDRVILPVLGSKFKWDLRAIDLERHGKPLKEEENADALKRAEDSAAEWLLCDSEKDHGSIYKNFGLLRVRYKVTEEGDCPGYTRGSVAWLCKEHAQRGLEAGILESYPMKFYDPELN